MTTQRDLKRLLDEVLARSLHYYLNRDNDRVEVGYVLIAIANGGDTFRCISNCPHAEILASALRDVAAKLEADTIGPTVGNA